MAYFQFYLEYGKQGKVGWVETTVMLLLEKGSVR
jgi:hypothetical protein